MRHTKMLDSVLKRTHPEQVTGGLFALRTISVLTDIPVNSLPPLLAPQSSSSSSSSPLGDVLGAAMTQPLRWDKAAVVMRLWVACTLRQTNGRLARVPVRCQRSANWGRPDQ